MNFIKKYYQRARIFIYNSLSENKIIGNPVKRQPVLSIGKGKIEIDNKVQLGYYPSPFFYNGVVHIEARNSSAIIQIKEGTFINNNFVVICDKENISIGRNCLIGTNVEVYDSDFHGIHPEKRRDSDYLCKPVKIKDNVFIGSNVKILKGVTIGENSIIASGSIVIKSVPDNVIAGGNPAKVLKSVFE